MDVIADMRKHEQEILSRANELGKFALPIAAVLPDHLQLALERLMLRGDIRFIDVSQIAHPDMPGFYRIFMVIPKEQKETRG